jgi:aminoglycoside 6'-N-acetyltransferase
MTRAGWLAKYANARIRQHDNTLVGEYVTVRPLTEQDWHVLFRWNNDPEVLSFAEGDDVTSRTMEEVKAIYRGVSQTAFYFMIEFQGKPIGECQLQQMNLERILDRYPEHDCRRIDIMIGEKSHWGRGLGTEAIELLTRFGFDSEHAGAIFGCDIADTNPRSRRAFEKNGYVVDGVYRTPPGSYATRTYDLVRRRDQAT